MYKCLKCGNTYKFTGLVKEEGNAIIYQNPDDGKDPDTLSWAIKTTDGKYKKTHHINRCYFCKSKEICHN